MSDFEGKNMEKLAVLIADDHTLFREGLRFICESLGDFHVVGEAENGRKAIELAKSHSPDIILMDISMPEVNGMQACNEIIMHNPSTKIIILTMYHEDNHLFDAIKAGARGFLLKDTSGEKLIAGVRAVHNGEILLPKDMAMKVLGEFRRLSQENVRSTDMEQLTPAEMNVLKLVAQGEENRSIAATLNVSEKTVSNRLSEIFAKLYVNNRTQAALVALRRGWVSLEPEES